MTENPATPSAEDRKLRSELASGFAIVGIATLLGPMIGALSIMAGPTIVQIVAGGGIASAVAVFWSFKFVIPFAYILGLIPALTWGILFCISVFVLRKNSVWTAIIAALLASPTGLIFVLQGPVGLQGEWWRFGLFFVIPSIIAGIVCWYVTKPFHKGSSPARPPS